MKLNAPETDKPDEAGMPLDDVLFWSVILAIMMIVGFILMIVLAARLGMVS